MNKVLGVVAVFTLALLCAQSAMAGEPRLIGSHGDWSAYVFIEDGNKVCYMASQPKKAEGKYSSRDEIFALVTHRPAEGTKNVFSYITGYSYKPGGDATITIDGSRNVLFTQDDTAWAPDAETDSVLADKIRSGSKMVVEGTSSRGTLTKDTFGLKGSGKAHDAISKECGV
ncbi:MAG: hypothetical protein DHS20C02_13140 [Micavibrio sp.]|nr:MAG: hypothetical protein DHS20C02_13140 [Micavibrio sp.]